MAPRRNSQRGITLVEACVAMAVTAVAAAAAVPSLQSLIDARRLDGAATQLATDIQFTRTLAVARNEPVRLTVQAIDGGSCYVIHTGNADQCRCGTSGIAACTGSARQIKTVQMAAADRVSLQANVGSILFDPLHGTSSPTGTLRVIGMQDRAVHHVINVMGRVRSCSPQAAVPGYRAC
jgi:type IV fimbrial biogenesis protein FimT